MSFEANGFKKPEKTLLVKITQYEAALLQKLRELSKNSGHGVFEVHIIGGEPRRVIGKVSEIIKLEDGDKLLERLDNSTI